MNLWAILGIVLIVIGVLVWVNVGLLQFIVGLAFVAAGAFLAARGFGALR